MSKIRDIKNRTVGTKEEETSPQTGGNDECLEDCLAEVEFYLQQGMVAEAIETLEYFIKGEDPNEHVSSRIGELKGKGGATQGHRQIEVGGKTTAAPAVIAEKLKKANAKGVLNLKGAVGAAKPKARVKAEAKEEKKPDSGPLGKKSAGFGKLRLSPIQKTSTPEKAGLEPLGARIIPLNAGKNRENLDKRQPGGSGEPVNSQKSPIEPDANKPLTNAQINADNIDQIVSADDHQLQSKPNAKQAQDSSDELDDIILLELNPDDDSQQCAPNDEQPQVRSENSLAKEIEPGHSLLHTKHPKKRGLFAGIGIVSAVAGWLFLAFILPSVVGSGEDAPTDTKSDPGDGVASDGAEQDNALAPVNAEEMMEQELKAGLQEAASVELEQLVEVEEQIPTRVKLELLINPEEAGAKVTFRGIEYNGNYFESPEVEPSDEQETLLVEAEGYHPQTIELTLDQNLSQVVQLESVPPVPPKVTRPPRRRRKKKATPPKSPEPPKTKLFDL